MKQPFIEVPINQGTKPDWNTRLGYPQIHNLFVGESGFLYPTPSLGNFGSLGVRIRAVKRSRFNGGRYIVVTDHAVYAVSKQGAFTRVADIPYSGLAVQMDENDQYQVIIVDGHRAYVYAQEPNQFVTLTQGGNGFGLETPISVVVINTIAIILDRDTNSWVISGVNNALTYPALATIPTIQSQLAQAVGLSTIENNLYIFGTQGIERWTPSLSNNTYLFPFSRDENFRMDVGASSTNNIERGLTATGAPCVYFVSSASVPMILSEQGMSPFGEPGISKVFSQYPDNAQSQGSWYVFRGQYFYHLTFETTGIAWVFNANTKTWGMSDDLILCSVFGEEVVGAVNGLYQLSLTPSYKLRSFRSPRITNYQGQAPYRNLINGVEVRMVQGYRQTDEPEHLELTLSLDSDSWLNTVSRPIGKTGERQAVVTWAMNIAAQQYTLRVDYHGALDFVIEKITAIIN